MTNDEAVELLLRMGLARRLGPYLTADPERVAEGVARVLLRDLDGIGFHLVVEWRGIEPEPDADAR